jgi:hypothetical protein
MNAPAPLKVRAESHDFHGCRWPTGPWVLPPEKEPAKGSRLFLPMLRHFDAFVLRNFRPASAAAEYRLHLWMFNDAPKV